MSEVAELTKTSRSKPKNNLNSFDTEQIKAELFAIESETFGSGSKDKSKAVKESIAPTPVVEVTTLPKPNQHERASGVDVNPIGFSADSSKLLHRASRTVAGQAPKAKPTPSTVSFKIPQKKNYTPSRSNAHLKTRPKSGMDGFSAPATSSLNPGLNTSAVALKGLQHANEFNSYSQRNYKTSMQAQIEKDSLFTNSFDTKPKLFDHGARDIDSIKRYTKLKRSHKMLGGVDQHDLGAGPLRRSLSGRAVKLITPLIALLLVGGYVLYLNTPKINLKFAESKSGISVSQPSYTPDGFKLARSIDAETGKVAMSFVKAGSTYNVTQSVSDWDSDALLKNKVLKESTDYSAYTDRGLTIYVYNGKAVWINQGKINEIDTASSGLQVEDIIRIAGSM